jgi:hypothetical protein
MFKLFIIWTGLLLFFLIASGDFHSQAQAVAVIICAIISGIFWHFKDRALFIVEKIKIGSFQKFILIGSVGAILLESIFWSVDRIFNKIGIIADSNLFIDLLLTMPWYIVMVALFWIVINRYHYSFAEIFLLGGIYDFFADGLFSGTVEGIMSYEYLINIIIGMPIFIIAYSVIVLPLSYLTKLETKISSGVNDDGNRENFKKYLFALLPIAGLLLNIVLYVFSLA